MDIKTALCKGCSGGYDRKKDKKVYPFKHSRFIILL